MEKKTHRLPRGCGYRIVRRLGSGGEGTVYLVCHLSTEQLRAAKILTSVHKERRHELDLMKHLDHPSLPKVIDVLEDGEDIWLIMEYIRGRRLDCIVGEGLSCDQLYSVALQLVRAVQYLHTRKEPILHLDIKPSNLLIRPDGSLVLIDFGAAIRGHPKPSDYDGYGTRGFAAPEQLKKGAGIDARTDIYGIGSTLYYCRFGRPPEAGIRCGGPLGDVMQKCLAKDPDRRYGSCEELLLAISKSRTKEKVKRRILPAAGALSCGVLLILTLAFSPGGTPREGFEAGMEEMAGTGTESPSEPEAETEPKTERETEWETETEPETEPETETETETEAYSADFVLQMLEQVTADGVFDAGEEDALMSLLFCAPDGSEETVWSLLQEDKENGGRAAYRLGLAYWYFYEGAGGKSTAAIWFDRALSVVSGKEAESWTATAEVLSRIGKYYGMLENTSGEKERLAMEWEYWNDLKDLWRLFTEQEEMSQVRTEQAKELLSLEILKAYEIGRCGESKEEMLRILSEVESFAEESDAPTELIGQGRAARAAVERAFQELREEEDLWAETKSVG